MRHSFEPCPKHPAVAYLIRLHADIGGRILDNKRQAERLAADAIAVEAVIKLFDPEFNARAIAARRRVTGNPWFRRGTLFRTAQARSRDRSCTFFLSRPSCNRMLGSHTGGYLGGRLGLEVGP
jgi:hypothetical protein